MTNINSSLADDVWVKKIDDENFDIIINETKLNAGEDLSPNQLIFKEYVDGGLSDFSLRSKKFGIDPALEDLNFQSNANLNLKGIVRTNADDLGDYSIVNF